MLNSPTADYYICPTYNRKQHNVQKATCCASANLKIAGVLIPNSRITVIVDIEGGVPSANFFKLKRPLVDLDQLPLRISPLLMLTSFTHPSSEIAVRPCGQYSSAFPEVLMMYWLPSRALQAQLLPHYTRMRRKALRREEFSRLSMTSDIHSARPSKGPSGNKMASLG